MRVSRRLTFQLTPLLDLLLIVIFAQYMEVQRSSGQAEETTQAIVTAAQTERDAARAQLEAFEQRASEAENSLRVAREEFQRKLALQEERIDQFAAERNRVGALARELFRVPEAILRKVLRQKTPAEQDQLNEQLKQLAAKRPRDVVEHLLTFDEVRKRCDIWRLHLQDDGALRFSSAGQEDVTLRGFTEEEFAAKIFESYKTRPQPKSLVIMLFSYGEVRFQLRQAALNGLRTASDRMRADSNGRSRFEYAVLGYRVEP